MSEASNPPTLSEDDAHAGSMMRHPVEALASDVVDSLRRSKDTSAIHSGVTRPDASARYAEQLTNQPSSAQEPVSAKADNQGSDEHEQAAEELQDLLPLIETLENARRKQVASVSKLATLGPARPDRLGDFLLKEIIGRGGMGVVFEALQESLGRIVAVKVLPSTMLSDTEQTERFDREARMAARLHHTNIVPVFGVGSQDGFHYFVMQRIDGRGLDQWISDSSEPLSPNQVALLGKQAADALAYAHSQGVLHRDVKPSNLIVSEDHRLWVTDFGVAKAMEAEVMTRTGDVVGTLRYMAPEQLLGESDTRSDVYGLGVTLYETLAGRPAIDDATLRDLLMHRRSAAAPPSLRSLNPNIPEDLQRIISTAMSREPADRYASADRMAADLQRFLDGKPISVRPLSRQQTFIRWCKRNPAIASLSAASLSLLLLATVASSVGFFTAREALVREQISREEAEQSSRLATEALQTIFDRFAPLGAAMLGDFGDLEAPERLASAPAALSPEAADLLEELLGYYDRLAHQKGAQQIGAHGTGAQTSNDASVAVAAFNANAAMGRIHFQLGNYAKSIESLTRAIKQMETVEFPPSKRERRLASLENQIGLAHRYQGDHEEAKRHHQQAFSILSKLESTTQVKAFRRTHALFDGSGCDARNDGQPLSATRCVFTMG